MNSVMEYSENRKKDICFCPVLNWTETGIRDRLPHDMHDDYWDGELKAVMSQAALLLVPRLVYRVYTDFSVALDEIQINGIELHCGSRATGLLRCCTEIVVLVATVGDDVSKLYRYYVDQGDMLRACLCDEVANWALDETVNTLVHDDVFKEYVTFPISPGCGSWALDEQPLLFTLLDAGKIGVTLSSSMLMRPLKSVSAIVGLGPAPITGNQCQYCGRSRCEYRKYRRLCENA